MTGIYALPLGYVNSFLIRGVGGSILIDTGVPGKEKKLWDQLGRLGIDGRVVHTPGHTSGSLAVIIEGKAAIVGDIIMKLPLLSKGSYRPVIGQDLEQVYRSWQKILDSGVETIHTAHGKPLPAARIEKELSEYLKRR